MKMKGDVEYSMAVSGINWHTRRPVLRGTFHLTYSKKLCITKTIRIHTKCRNDLAAFTLWSIPDLNNSRRFRF